MSLRDDLLPVVDDVRLIPGDFGFRRYGVTIRRRVWSGNFAGDGTPTDQDIVLSPIPRVRNSFSSASLRPETLQYILANGGVIDDRYYQIDRITPAYVSNGVAGGYSAQQLRLKPPTDAKNVECIVVLVGDDGFKRDCEQVTFEQDRAFKYAMLVRESDRPRVALTSLAITPSVPAAAVGAKVKLTATGTFADGTTSDLTPLVTWTSATPGHATVDLLGVLSGVAAGTSVITASLTGISTTATATVS
jgi:hypothetical protein